MELINILLIALLREEEGVADQILRDIGVDPQAMADSQSISWWNLL